MTLPGNTVPIVLNVSFQRATGKRSPLTESVDPDRKQKRSMSKVAGAGVLLAALTLNLSDTYAASYENFSSYQSGQCRVQAADGSGQALPVPQATRLMQYQPFAEAARNVRATDLSYPGRYTGPEVACDLANGLVRALVIIDIPPTRLNMNLGALFWMQARQMERAEPGLREAISDAFRPVDPAERHRTIAAFFAGLFNQSGTEMFDPTGEELTPDQTAERNAEAQQQREEEPIIQWEPEAADIRFVSRGEQFDSLDVANYLDYRRILDPSNDNRDIGQNPPFAQRYTVTFKDDAGRVYTAVLWPDPARRGGYLFGIRPVDVQRLKERFDGSLPDEEREALMTGVDAGFDMYMKASSYLFAENDLMVYGAFEDAPDFAPALRAARDNVMRLRDEAR